MDGEDVIELGSSDDEDEAPASKKMKTLPNVMVHIPNKIREVTINPVACNKNKLPRKMVTSTPGRLPIVTVSDQQSKTNGRYLQKLTPQLPCRNLKSYKPLQLQNKLNNYPLKMGNKDSGIQGLRVQGQRVQEPSSRLTNNLPSRMNSLPSRINSLPSSITVTKTYGGSSTSHTGVLRNKIRVNKDLANKKVAYSNNKIYPTGHLGEFLTVELDDDENSLSTVANSNPQWYLRPEEQLAKNKLEEQNNSEPKVKEMIEITIEDSPVKPSLLEGAKNLNETLSITVEDSPVKVLNNLENEAALGSNIEQEKPKSPKSKKKLGYLETGKCINIEVPMEIESGEAIPCLVNKEKGDLGTTIVNRPVTPTVDLELENDSSQMKELTEVENFIEKTNEVDKKESTGKDIDVSNVSNGEFHSTFQRFMDLCLELDNSEDMKTIIEKRIKTYSRQVPKEFVESEQFLDTVSTKITLIKSEPSKIYLHIKDIVDELKLHRKRKKATPLVNENDPVEDIEDDNKYDRKRLRQIRKLEKTLKKLERAINKLDEQEVDFDDEEDSVYLLNDRYKERFVRTYAKLCQLTGNNVLTEPRIVIESRPGQPPGPAKKLEKWVNKKVPIGSALPFPDFHDVIKCVKEANAEDNLGWNESDILNEARDLFTRCGKKLQRRRQENEWRLAAAWVTQDDPAERDETLRKKLDESKERSSKKETELLNKYAHKQNQLQLEATEIDEKDADNSPVESDDEIDDDSNLLEDSEKRKHRLLRLINEKESKKKSINNTDQQTDIINKKEFESISFSIVNKKDEIKTVNDQDIIDVDQSKPTEKKMATERRNSVEKSNNSNNILSDIENKDTCESGDNVKEIGLSHETTAVNSQLNVDDEENIHSICDDFYGDELNLLEKLNSGKETSSPESSDLDESPIAISDSLGSNSDSEYYDTCDVISIENSSSSETETAASLNKDENKCTFISNNAVTHDLACEVSNSHNIDAFKAATIAVNDITASDEETENILLVYPEDEDCNKYVNLQDDSITIGETFVGVFDDTESFAKDVEPKKCKGGKFKDKVISVNEYIDEMEKQTKMEKNDANDEFKCRDDVILKDENVNDMSMSTSEATVDLVAIQESANQEVELKKRDIDYNKHKDVANRGPTAEIVNISNDKLDADECMLISEEGSILEGEDFCSCGPEYVCHKDNETLIGETYDDNSRKKDTMSKNVNSCIKNYDENDHKDLSISENLMDESICSDGKPLKDVITNKIQSQSDDIIIKSGNDDIEIEIDKIPHHETFLNNAVNKNSINIDVEFNKWDQTCVLRSNDSHLLTKISTNRIGGFSGTCSKKDENIHVDPVQFKMNNYFRHDFPTKEGSGELIRLKASREPITLEMCETVTVKGSGAPISLDDKQDSKILEASGKKMPLETNLEPRILEAIAGTSNQKLNEEPIPLAVSEEPLTFEAQREPTITLEAQREPTITLEEEPITLEAQEEPITLEAQGEPINLRADGEPISVEASEKSKSVESNKDLISPTRLEPIPSETSGVNNQNVSSTNERVSPTVQKSTTLEHTFNMVEMMLDKLFNPPT